MAFFNSAEKIKKLTQKVKSQTGIEPNNLLDGFDAHATAKLLPVVRKALLEILRERKIHLTLEELNDFLQNYGFLEIHNVKENYKSPYTMNFDDSSGIDIVENNQILLAFIGMISAKKNYRRVLDISCYSEAIEIYYPDEGVKLVEDYFACDKWTSRHFSSGTPYNLFLRSYAKTLLHDKCRHQTLQTGISHGYALAKILSYCSLSGVAITAGDDLDMYVLRSNYPSIKWCQGGVEQLAHIDQSNKYDLIFNFVLPTGIFPYMPRQHESDYSIQDVYPFSFERLKDDGMYITLMHDSNFIDKNCIDHIVDNVGFYPAAIIPINSRDIYLICWKKGLEKSYIIPFVDSKPEEESDLRIVVDDIIKGECRAHHARRTHYAEFYSIKHDELAEKYRQYADAQRLVMHNFNDLIISIGPGKNLEDNNSVFIPVTESMYNNYGVMGTDEYISLRSSYVLFDNFMFDVEKTNIQYNDLFWYTENNIDAYCYDNGFSEDYLYNSFDKYIEDSVIQIVFQPQKVNASFIKCFLNSPHGRVYLDIIRAQDLQGYFRLEHFLSNQLYLPDMEAQTRLYEDFKVLSVDIAEKQVQRKELFARINRDHEEKNVNRAALLNWSDTLP